tara:strand:+ start:727 stop:1578 length:852 start_codon:yes stop_codon:yes gene_type:complete
MKFKTIAVCALSALALAACGKVSPGYEGVIVDNFGSQKALDMEEVGVGWHFYGIGKELVTYPVYTQNLTWDDGRRDCSAQIVFQDRDGQEISADIGLSYHVEQGMSAEIYEKYRRSIDEITCVFVKNNVRDGFNNLTSTMTAEEIYSGRKTELINGVEDTVGARLAEVGFIMEDLYWAGPIDLPESIRAAVDLKVAATQEAQQRQNEVATAKADADKKIEEARGDAVSIELRSVANAEAIAREGAALRDNPEVLALREIEAWNGAYPQTYVGGEGQPLLMLGK